MVTRVKVHRHEMSSGCAAASAHRRGQPRAGRCEGTCSLLSSAAAQPVRHRSCREALEVLGRAGSCVH